MFLNDTILMTMFTINMIVTMHDQIEIQSPGHYEVIHRNTTTTTLSMEKEEDYFDLEDDWNMWKCYYPFGCFYKDGPWLGGDRLVSRLPQQPDDLSSHYMLYTRSHLSEPHELFIDNFDSIKKSPLKNTNSLYFIIHGYWDNGNNSWILTAKDELLIREDCNVVVVDWARGASGLYNQAVANTRLVGAMTARLAAQLIEVGHVPVRRMHAIGHSLGAHISGYIGSQLRTKYGYTLRRITGLDPARPDFEKTLSVVRLDPTDAEFVTVIHTDTLVTITELGAGMAQPIGHIDFYPNGGLYQPGCNNGGIIQYLKFLVAEKSHWWEASKRYIACSHIRSYEFFIESINTQCPFIAVPCASWSLFQEGGCFDCANQYCPRFGLDAEPRNYHASMYLMTGSEKPFCKGHYRVMIRISKNNDGLAHDGIPGMFVIRVIGTDGKMTEKISLSTDDKVYKPGTIHTTVLTGDIVGKPEAAEITWKRQLSFNPWAEQHVEIDSLTIDSLESGHGITVCTNETKMLINKVPRNLTSDNCQPTDTNEVPT